MEKIKNRNLINRIRQLTKDLDDMKGDFNKTLKGNKSAAQRLRVSTVAFAKNSKVFRLLSQKIMPIHRKK